MPARIYMTAVILLLLAAPALHATGEDDLFARIMRENSNGGKSVSELCIYFVKKYPRSPRLPHVRIIQADAETDPASAAAMFRSVARSYPRHERSDYAQFRLCEIRNLLADWVSLKDEARHGMERFPGSAHQKDFRFFYIASALKMYQFETAGEALRSPMPGPRDYETQAGNLLVQAYIDRRRDGYSRAYIYTLRELLTGYEKSSIHPSILYLLGDFYDHTNDPGRALAAWEDLDSLYPRSPEAGMSRDRLRELRTQKTSRVSYYPDDATIRKTDSIDISPDMAVRENNDASFFAVSIGPFESVQRASQIKKLLRDFEPVNTVRIRDGFIHYVGKSPSLDRALSIKIRLAEELGMNGNIVRVSGSGESLYIYGE